MRRYGVPEMAFFLLGRGRPAGELRLISTELFDSRQQALDALGLLSGQSGFEHTDAEVFVVDLDAATPVLLVATPAPAPVSEPEEPAEPASKVSDEAETVGVWESPAEPEPEVEEIVQPVEVEPDLVEPAIAEAVLAEESEVPAELLEPAEDESTEVETPTEFAGSEGGLRDALAGAAVTLEESGIVAPDSIGPAPETPATAAAWPWDSSAGGEPVVDVEPAPDLEPEPEPEPAPEPEPQSEPEPAPEPEPVYIPGPYDEPAIDGGDSLIGPGDEDAFELSRPVILGAYDESPPEVEEAEYVAEPEAELVTGPAVDPAEVSLEAALADIEPLEPEAADGLGAAEVPDISDFAPEPGLGDIPVAPTAEAGDESSVMTCEDCVYVNTCPNKDERDPSTCGSFQWKSIV